MLSQLIVVKEGEKESPVELAVRAYNRWLVDTLYRGNWNTVTKEGYYEIKVE